MRSMTGYGRGEVDHDGAKFSVELNSVNRKQSDIVVNLPRDLAELEPRIRQAINEKISRGRTNVVVALHNGAERSAQARARYRPGPLLPRSDARVAKRIERAGRDHHRHDSAGAGRDAVARRKHRAERGLARRRARLERRRWRI